MLLSHLIEYATGLSQFPCRHWKPRDESNLLLFAELQNLLMLAITQVVLVLHTDDLDRFARPFDLFRRNLRQSNVANLTCLLELLERA